MTYVIGKPCVDVMDRACVEECPVDCIYEGGRALYIHPDECVDCGACEPVCPVEAIYYEDDLPEDLQPYQADNAAFFFEPFRAVTSLWGHRAEPPRWARSASTHRWWPACPNRTLSEHERRSSCHATSPRVAVVMCCGY